MRSQRFIFPGNPIPLARPRFSGNHCWDSQKQSKLVTGLLMSKQFGSQDFFIGPIQVDFDFVFPTPKRISQSKKEALYNTPFVNIPDTDNCIKFYLDCANNILFKDDACVAIINAQKIYGPEAQVVMFVKEIKEWPDGPTLERHLCDCPYCEIERAK